MKQRLVYIIWLPTKAGLISREVEAVSYRDAFKQLSHSDKFKEGWIEGQLGDSHTFNEILGIEETI